MTSEDISVLEEANALITSHDSKVNKIWILSHAGSRTYGTETATSDHDYKGVYRAPEVEDFFRQEVQHPFKIGGFDASLTAQVSFLKQLRKGSFTAVEVLWDDNPLILDDEFKKVFWKNPRFLTEALGNSYWGCFKSYVDYIKLNSQDLTNPSEKLKKAVYHSFRNLEFIERIAETAIDAAVIRESPRIYYGLKLFQAEVLKKFRNGESEIEVAIEHLGQLETRIQKVWLGAIEYLPPPVTLEELFDISAFMRKY
jgi:hypothetical protein